MSARIFRSIFVLGLLLLPSFAFAQVTITEIFYSPAKSAWVEVYNASSTPVDLTKYKILDSGASVNGHAISMPTMGLLGPNSYAIIAKDTSIFADAKYPVYKASLGMKVSGDTLILKDPSGRVADKVIFTASEGGAGDGNSLQKIGNGWQALPPTQGADASTAIVQKITTLQNKITVMSSNTTTHTGTTTSSQTATSTSLIFSDRPATSHHWWDTLLRFFGLE